MIIFFFSIFDFCIFSHICFHAQNWFDASFFTFLEKFYRTKNIAMISNCQCFELVFLPNSTSFSMDIAPSSNEKSVCKCKMGKMLGHILDPLALSLSKGASTIFLERSNGPTGSPRAGYRFQVFLLI